MLKNFLVIALRSFRKNGLYSAINIFGLSIGLAAAIIIMLYVRHELLTDKYHEHYDELYRVGIEIGIGGPPLKAGISSYPAGPDLTERFPEVVDFTRIFAMDLVNTDLLVEYGDKGLYEKGVLLVDSNFFDLFTHPVLFGDPNAALRHNDVAVLTRSTAERIFGPGDPVGKNFRLNRQHNIEVGAVIEDLPDNSHLKFRMLLYWNSLGNFLGQGMATNSYFQNNFFTYIRANQDLTTPEFTAKLEAFVEEHVLGELATHGLEGTFRLHMRPMRELYFLKDEMYEPFNPEPIPAKGDRVYVYVFITIAMFLTTIAAINYMNMAIARSSRRSREVGVRKVMGADKGSLIRQFLTESLLISFLALILALLWVEIFLPYFNDLLMKNLSFSMIAEPQFGLWVLAMTLFVGLLSGSYPAFYLSGFRPIEVLKQQVILSDRNLFVRKILVGLQFAISVFMIIATLAVLQQLMYMRDKDLGYTTEQILIINIADLDADRREGLKRELEQLAMVDRASLSMNLPGPGSALQQWGFNVETEDGFVERMTSVYHVDPYFAEVYQLEMAEGRFFDPNQPTDMEQAFVINEAAVRLFGWDDAVGKQIQHFGSQGENARRVIGVVRDFHMASFEQQINPLIIFPAADGSYANLGLSPGDVSGTLRSVEQIWHEFAGVLPLRYQFMDERQGLAQLAYTNLGSLFALFALLCIFLSLMGLFGLSGFSAEQKTKEIGIRKVHGASQHDILALLYKEYVWLMMLAIVIASAVGWYFADSWLSQFAYRIQISMFPFVAAAILSFGVSLMTVGYHAWRSMRRNPAETLQYE